MIRAALMGGTGYGGAEIARQLLQHPKVELVRISSIDHVGKKLGDVHLSLAPLTDLVLQNLSPTEVAKDVDVVFLALPHKVSYLMVPELIQTGVRIIDLSGDFRIRNVEVYNRFYHTEHPHPELIQKFVYGLPELNRERIAKAQYIASPGCFATGIALALLPLAQAGLLNGPVSCVAATGSSGSGTYAKTATHHPLRAQNLKAYKILKHQHTPEILQTLRDAGASSSFHLDFIPLSAPLVRGILSTCVLSIPETLSEEEIDRYFEKAYGSSPFIRKVKGRSPEVIAVAGSNYVEVGFEFGEKHGDQRSLATFSAIDNLVKGGAGQAIQSMNLMFGLEETEGVLGNAGLWP